MRLLIILSMLATLAFELSGADEELKDLSPYVVRKKDEANTFRVPDLKESLAKNRKEFGVALLEIPGPECILSFQAFVFPQLMDCDYAISGRVCLSKAGVYSGTVSLHDRTNNVVETRSWDLTAPQAMEVRLWFADAGFLDPRCLTDSTGSVLDGVILEIDGYTEGRHFELRRNACDSPRSAGFLTGIRSFLVWKARPEMSASANSR